LSYRNLAIPCGIVCLAVLLTAGDAVAQAAGAPLLRLEDAFARALSNAPALQAANEASRAADAGIRLADRRINPTLDIGVENAAGSGAYHLLDRAETTLSISQTLERGGDRAARTGLARTEANAVRADGAVRRQDILLDVELAYITAQTAAADLAVANDRLAVAKEIVATVDRRVKAARDPLMAASRAQALLSEADIAVTSARLADEAARRRLASYWRSEAAFSIDLSSFGNLAAKDAPESGANASPEITRARAEEDRATAAVQVERARVRPDATVSAGVRYFHEYDEAALVVGVSIPLSIWNTNSAALDRAEAERAKSRLETEALKRNVARELASAAAQIDIARAEVESIDAQLLPAARQTLDRAREGYAAGGFSYLDVLDAQRVLVDAQLRRNATLASYHRARAALARLTGAYAGAAPAGEISR